MCEKMRVLLIQGSRADIRAIRKMLDQKGEFEIVCADTLSAGLEKLAADGIDVVLLDLGLPDSKGLATLARAHAEAPEVPIVVLTARDSDTLAVEAVKAGAQDYLVRGQVGARMLARAIRHAVERKRLEQALRESEERYRRLVESALDAILVHSEGKILFVNAAGARLAGAASAEELIGKPLADFVHPDQRQAVSERIRQISETAEVPRLAEEKYVRLDGSVPH